MISQIEPWIDEKEFDEVKRVIDSTYLTESKITAEFEAGIQQLTQSKHSIATSNGTTALYCGLKALDIGYGDEAALLSAMVYALAMLQMEKLLRYLPNITFLTWRCIISLIFITPFVWIKGDSIFPSTTTGWLAILGLGLICEVIARS